MVNPSCGTVVQLYEGSIVCEISAFWRPPDFHLELQFYVISVERIVTSFKFNEVANLQLRGSFFVLFFG
jgi:hypothetical protein